MAVHEIKKQGFLNLAYQQAKDDKEQAMKDQISPGFIGELSLKEKGLGKEKIMDRIIEHIRNMNS